MEEIKIEDKKWCVYMHINKINNKAYIGVTSRNPKDRWGNNGSGYRENQQIFHRAIQKYGWENFEHIIWKDNLSEEESKHIERLLIALFKTNCKRYNKPSYGYNCTDGGDGCTGYLHSEEIKEKIKNQKMGHIVPEETRHKISKSLKGKMSGNNHPMFGISPKERMDEETYILWKQHLSESNSGTNHPNYGKHLSEKTKKKISESHKNLSDESRKNMQNAQKKFPVLCLELNIVYCSTREVERQTSINHSDVKKVCEGKRQTAGGYRWKFIYDQQQNDGAIIMGAISLGLITEEDVIKQLK